MNLKRRKNSLNYTKGNTYTLVYGEAKIQLVAFRHRRQIDRCARQIHSLVAAQFTPIFHDTIDLIAICKINNKLTIIRHGL